MRSLLEILPSNNPSIGALTPCRSLGVSPLAAREQFTSDDALSGVEPGPACGPVESTLPCPDTAFDLFITTPRTEHDAFLVDQDAPFFASFGTSFTLQPSTVVHQIHLSLPSHCPLSPEDQRIATLIHRVKCGELLHAADPPGLMEYMLDGSHDSLAGCLKDYLEPLSRARKSLELLATYWIVYTMVIVRLSQRAGVLFLMTRQWQAYQTPECFERLPPWLRPTQCQIEAPHPMCIDFIPW